VPIGGIVSSTTASTAAAPSRAASSTAAHAEERTAAPAYIWALTRIGMGFLFLWAFLDKTFGLGLATPSEGAWIDGGSPTQGYLSSATGPFEGIYHDIAGAGLVNWLFMLGLLGVGVALILGIGLRVAGIAGALMTFLMWTTHLWPETNPFLDEHLIYSLVLLGLPGVRAGHTLGLGRWWNRLGVVQRNRWLA